MARSTQTDEHPLTELHGVLAEAVARRDSRQLAELLRGWHLPALGGDREPADIVFMALDCPAFDFGLAQGLSELLGEALAARDFSFRDEKALDYRTIDEVAEPVEDPGWETLLTNALMLAANLPAHPRLFAALKELRGPSSVTAVAPRLSRLLDQALTYQQCDDSLEAYWLEQIGSHRSTSELLAAWRGLLWIPPTESRRESGEVIDADRLSRGLRELVRALRDSHETGDLLRRALTTLSATFPRSAAFWGDLFRPQLAKWPKALQKAVTAYWPALMTHRSV